MGARSMSNNTINLYPWTSCDLESYQETPQYLTQKILLRLPINTCRYWPLGLVEC